MRANLFYTSVLSLYLRVMAVTEGHYGSHDFAHALLPHSQAALKYMFKNDAATVERVHVFGDTHTLFLAVAGSLLWLAARELGNNWGKRFCNGLLVVAAQPVAKFNIAKE